ncbi:MULTISPECIES: exonuclease III [Pseudoalteromonas]|uniref:exonuclease III n=1 Tax=Pseudoalteromonas TaxID=53246 RepID=UPI000FFE7414|nr:MULTISPECIES: exonuclease III [Pseudoalteromonas]MCG9760184.1 exonuclease III [Pseudoalteromonas sp. Isolate6]NKC18407.1 exonuclease III [Pseudoalteromonas galatheae]RXE85046.1 exonuclease III [Pseudoalteromonas sp. A757]
MLKSLSFFGLVSLVSTTAFASQVEFTQADASPATKVCAVAAEQGFSAARREASSLGLFISRFSPSIHCNGEDIREFAKAAKRSQKQEKKVELIAEKTDTATELCLDAVRHGVNHLRLNNQQVRNLRCNDMPVKQFVKEFRNAAI